MPKHKYEVIIIGAGSAGLAALREVRKKTGNFLLVNDGPYGTTCARVGCMPSKALIEAASAFQARHGHEEFGIRGAEGLRADIPAVLRRVRKMRDRFVAGTIKATADLADRSIAGRARFIAPDLLDINGERFQSRRIIIATGSHPVVPAAWARLEHRILTTDTLFEQDNLPGHIGVIGLGPVGIECAQALARLGIRVSAFGQGDVLAGLSDPKVSAVLQAALAAEFDLHTGSKVEPEQAGSGVRLRLGGKAVTVDRVLLAIGREPAVADLGLEHLGVPLDERGLPPCNPETTRIADLPVYIAGDANSHAPILHEAADEGHIAGRNAVAEVDQCYRRRVPMGIIFADPGVAFVGQRHAALDPAQIVIGESDYTRQGRALTAQRNQGLMRIYASRADARLLGVEMCVPGAEHMAHLFALAIDRELSVADLLRMPFYHPVLEEGLRTALRDLARQLDHRLSDLAACSPYDIEALD